MNAATGAKNFIYHLHQLVESGLAIGQADTDAPLETYVLTDSDSVVCFDKTKPHGLWGKGMLHKQFGKNQRLMTGSYQIGIDIHTADIDGDGLDEVLVAGTQLSRFWQPTSFLGFPAGSAACTNRSLPMNSRTFRRLVALWTASAT